MCASPLNLHVEGNKGQRELATDAAKWMRMSAAVVVNDLEQARQLELAGLLVFYREKSARIDDDNSHQHIDGALHVRLLHEATKDVCPNAVLYINNEPGQWDLPTLRRETMKAIEEANRLGRIICIFNWAYGNPEPLIWEQLTDIVQMVVAGGHWIGVHEGWDVQDPGETAYPWKIGRFLDVKAKYGGNWIVTELTWSKNAYEGFSPTLTEEEYAAKLEWAAAFYAYHGVIACIFTFFEWQTGFHIYNRYTLQSRIREINQKYPVVKETTVTYTMRDYLCPPNGQKYRLIGIGDEACQCIALGDYGRQLKNEIYEELWSDSNFVYRGMDTSSYRLGEVYAQYTDINGRVQYGAPWCPAYWDGKPFLRTPLVMHFRTPDGMIKQQGVVPSYLRIKKHHPVWTSKSGRVVNDVLELQWSFSTNFNDIVESYFYAKGFGLVAFSDKNGQASYIANEPPVYIPATREMNFSFGWVNPPPLVKGSSVVDRNTLGTPQQGYVVKTKANNANVREQPNESAKIVGTIQTGNVVVYRPTLYKSGNYNWYALESPFGWVADVATISPSAPPVPIKKLVVPYVSQSSADATKKNDCGPATWLMQYRSRFPSKFPTVDDVSRHTSLWTTDDGLTIQEMKDVSEGYGVPLTIQKDLKRGKLVTLIDAGYSVAVLGLYSQFRPVDSFDGGHFLLVIGYDANGFWVHDPYNLGADSYITNAQMDAAMAPYGHQGWTLT